MTFEDFTFQRATPSVPTTLMSKAFVFYFGRCPVWMSGRTPIFLAEVSREFATYSIPVNGWKWWASISGSFTYVNHCTENLMAPWIGLSQVCTNFCHQLAVVYIFLQRHRILVGIPYETCCMSPFYCPEFWGELWVFENVVCLSSRWKLICPCLKSNTFLNCK